MDYLDDYIAKTERKECYKEAAWLRNIKDTNTEIAPSELWEKHLNQWYFIASRSFHPHDTDKILYRRTGIQKFPWDKT